MSRMRNLLTGQNQMTTQNALRHYISKAIKAKNSGNTQQMIEIYQKANDELFIDICSGCDHDDLGYYCFRKGQFSYEHKIINYCFDNFIDGMRRMLYIHQGKNFEK